MAHLHFGLRQDLMRVSRFQRGASTGIWTRLMRLWAPSWRSWTGCWLPLRVGGKLAVHTPPSTGARIDQPVHA